GRVLEIGAGTGLNLPHYPASVTELVLTEPDAGMVARLRRRVARRPDAAGTGAAAGRGVAAPAGAPWVAGGAGARAGGAARGRGGHGAGGGARRRGAGGVALVRGRRVRRRRLDDGALH